MARLVGRAIYGPALRSVESAIGVLASATGRLRRGVSVSYRNVADVASQYVANAMAEVRSAGPTEITQRSLEMLSQAQSALSAQGFSGPALPPPIGPIWGMTRVPPGAVTAGNPQGIAMPTASFAQRMGGTALSAPLSILYGVRALLSRYND